MVAVPENLGGGWLYNPAAIEAVRDTCSFSHVYHANPRFAGLGAGKVVLQWRAFRKVLNRIPHVYQKFVDCTGASGQGAVDLLRCIDIAVRNEPEAFIAESCAEIIYGGSRHQIGKDALRNGGGSNVSWCAKWLKEFGITLRLLHQIGGKTFDLREYSGERSKEYGRPGVGCPEELAQLAKQNPIEDFTFLESWEQARDASAAGCTCWFGWNGGFGMDLPLRRDKDGFINRTRGQQWGHAWYTYGMRDDGRPGLATPNTWPPNWLIGPKWPDDPDTPDETAWIDAEWIDAACREGEGIALTNARGWPATIPNFDVF